PSGVTLPASQQVVPSDKGARRRGVSDRKAAAASSCRTWSRAMPRGLIPTLLFSFTAIIFFGLGGFLAARNAAASEDDQIAALRSEVSALRMQQLHPVPSGTSGRPVDVKPVAMDDHGRAELVADIKQQLRTEMGLVPVSLLRERRQSFVEMYSYDVTGSSNYGTAGYLGDGDFITVKHGVIGLGDSADSRRITPVKILDGHPARRASSVHNGRAKDQGT